MQHQKEYSADKINLSFYLILLSGVLFILTTEIGLILINFVYLSLTTFKLIIIYLYYTKDINAKIKIKNESSYDDLPIYTVLLPLYKEQNSIKQLINGIKMLNYPKEKLEILIILEEDDKETFLSLKNINTDFKVIIVPNSIPKTKGKACNYAINFIHGEYITVYDAEDIPSKMQLLDALQKFSILPDDYVAIQARLNYYNRDFNTLTKLFSLEYSFQFDYLLPTLAFFGIFVPLGGSSNHLKVSAMNNLNWWDSFNVTEDIALAIEIFMNNKKIAIIESLTLEEAPIKILQWIKQRSRWIKGFLQTFMVSIHYTIFSNKKLGLKNTICFYFITIFPIIGHFCLPYFFIHPFFYYKNNLLIYLSWFNCIFGLISATAINLMIIKKNNWKNYTIAIFCLPFYWFLSFVATLKAIYELCTRPYFWDKTDHFNR